MTDTPTTPGTDVDLRDALLEVRTPAEAQALFLSMGFDPNDDDADGIRSIEVVDKDTLVGVPFLALRWQWNESDEYGGEFVFVECMKEDGTIVVINDGSTGLFQQLRDLTDHRMQNGHAAPTAGRMVKRGLRRSDYRVEVNGKEIAASTYYLSF